MKSFLEALMVILKGTAALLFLGGLAAALVFLIVLLGYLAIYGGIEVGKTVF